MKGAAHHFFIRTRRLSLPIISSLKALLARRLFHPRTPTRSFVSLLGACLLESGTTALVFARWICHLGVWQEASSLLPEDESAPILWRCQSRKGGDQRRRKTVSTSLMQSSTVARSALLDPRIKPVVAGTFWNSQPHLLSDDLEQ